MLDIYIIYFFHFLSGEANEAAGSVQAYQLT